MTCYHLISVYSFSFLLFFFVILFLHVLCYLLTVFCFALCVLSERSLTPNCHLIEKATIVVDHQHSVASCWAVRRSSILSLIQIFYFFFINLKTDIFIIIELSVISFKWNCKFKVKKCKLLWKSEKVQKSKLWSGQVYSETDNWSN